MQPSRPVTRDDSESSLGALSEVIKSSTWSLQRVRRGAARARSEQRADAAPARRRRGASKSSSG